MAYKKSPAELSTELLEQQQALKSSCANYDDGNSWEAKRIATCLYMLLYDTDRSRSLLLTLGIKHDIRYISASTPVSPGNLMHHAPLVVMAALAGESFRYVPISSEMDMPTHSVSFDTWWNEVVYAESNEGTYGSPLSRKDLIYIMRSQDGGAHIDSKITNDLYRSFSQGAGWYTVDPNTPVMNAHLATMRQMAWELIESINRYFVQLRT